VHYSNHDAKAGTMPNASVMLSYELPGAILGVVLDSAAATDAIGVHPLFEHFWRGFAFRG